MPGGDGTGPMGMGQMAGRRAGWCTGNYPRFCRGRAWAMEFDGTDIGWTGGRGFARRTWSNTPVMSREVEVDMLKSQAANLEAALVRIKEQLSRLSENE